MDFRYLGPLEVAEQDTTLPLGGPKQRAVLARLLVGANSVVSTDQLIDDVWGEEPPAAARSTLQSYVSHLRRVLGADRIAGRAPGYLLRVAPGEVDALRFEALVTEARASLHADPDRAIRTLRAALALWRGPPLADLADEPSVRGEIARLEEMRLSATEQLAAAEVAAGRHADAVAELERLTAANPLRERLWEQLMLALYRSGRQADALEAYQRARRILSGELGIEPSPSLQRLQHQVLTQDPGLEVVGQPLRGYRLVERIGEGAFGIVHRALQPQVGREVAVKVVRPELANDPEFIRRFEAEAQMVARLEHPHIVPLYDYWRDPDGAYLVMRWLRGGSLRQRAGRQPLELDAAIRLVDQIASALAVAHRAGVVHRDVKPSNVLLDEEGNAYLSDFGIAADLVTPSPTSEDRAGERYRSPEQLRGELPTPRSDIYALGLVLFELLSGGQPYRPEGPSLATLRPDIPAAIDDVLAQALADDPARRFADPLQFADAVRRLLFPSPAAARPRAIVAVTNPYKGLRPFLEADAPDFFGREAVIDQLLGRLAEPVEGARFLAVIGPSGSGKSSVVRAGLIPALRRGALPSSAGWYVVEMVPGANPLEELEAALLRIAVNPPPSLIEQLQRDDRGLLRAVKRVLPSDDSELLLVVDQFEELFTLVADEDRRAHFLRSLTTAVTDPLSRLRVVVTMRADFYDRPLAYRDMGELVRLRSETLLPLAADEVERAIAYPVRRLGVAPEPGLVARMVGDVSDQPGSLPLLQYALTELFERRERATLTLEAYAAIGGVSGAIARRAEEVYGRLDQACKHATRQLFLRLIMLGEASDETRRRVPRAELTAVEGDPAAMERAIGAFGRTRLISFDRDPQTRAPTVEVAHEALLREWGRLQGWIEASREDVREHRRLVQATAEWAEAGRDASFLLAGTRLEQVEAWRATSELALTEEERGFVEASLAARAAQQAEAAARLARERALERRAIFRLRALAAVLGLAALVAGGLTLFAFDQSRRAEQQARVATARELAAAALANLDDDPELSILLALEAVGATRSADGSVLREAEEALHAAVQASRVVHAFAGGEGALDMSADGTRLATAQTEVAVVWDLESGEEAITLSGHSAPVLDVAYSPDGRFLATASLDGTARLWDAATGAERLTLSGHDEGAVNVEFSPDGALLLTAAGDGLARIWEVPTGAEVARLPDIGTSDGLALSTGGDRVAVANTPFGVVWDVDTGREILSVELQETLAIALSPDGALVAVGGLTQDGEGVTTLWDIDAREERLSVFGHGSAFVTDAAFYARGSRLATVGHDGTARLWDVAGGEQPSGRELLALSGLGAAIHDVAVSADGDRVAAAAGGRVVVWDATPAGSRELRTIPAHAGTIFNVTFSPDGALLATASLDGLARVWDVATWQQVLELSDHASAVADIVFSPDGEQLATASFDHAAMVRPATGGEPVILDGHTDFVWGASFSPDGERLATVSQDRTGKIWDVSSGETEFLLEGHTDFVYDVTYSPDGTQLATVSNDFTARLWDAETGEPSHVLRGHDDNVLELAFSPDGTRLATASFDGTARVWEVATGDELLALRGHAAAVLDVDFTPDGRRVVTASLDGTVRLWDAGSGEELLTLSGAEAGRLAVSPDGKLLAAARGLGLVSVYLLDIEDLVELARERVTRPLTDDECRQYLHLEECPPVG